MPLAVVRKQVKDLPLELRLDDSSGINPEHKLSAASQVVITARVSRSGEATPQSGDLEGSTAPIKLPLDQTVVVAISRAI
jgi:cytochrome c-type biogenesis protein CcmH